MDSPDDVVRSAIAYPTLPRAGMPETSPAVALAPADAPADAPATDALDEPAPALAPVAPLEADVEFLTSLLPEDATGTRRAVTSLMRALTGNGRQS